MTSPRGRTIAIDRLGKDRRGTVVVQDVTLTAVPGEVTCLVGPNGAGKSTVLKCLAGLWSPTRGTALIDSSRYARLPDPAGTVGFHLDATASHAGRTGGEELALACLATRQPRSRVDEIGAQVGLASRVLRRSVRTYSLGMRQRLGIGVALVADAGTLVLDEPFNGLDPDGIRWVSGLLRRYADEGRTVLITNHFLAEMDGLVDRLYSLDGSGHGSSSATMSDLRATAAVGTSGGGTLGTTLERWYDDATRG